MIFICTFFYRRLQKLIC